VSTRRDFLRASLGAAAVGALPAGALALPTFRPRALSLVAELGADARGALAVADDEDFWATVQRAFDVDRTLVNLNNGGVSPTPTHVLDAMMKDLRFSNGAPVYEMWQVLEPRIEGVRRELAREFGCDAEELAIVRNASEALETLILGLDLRRGDEALVTTQNYPRMLTTWDQRARRDGIVVRQLTFPAPLPDPAQLVETFRRAITPRTRVMELPHLVNWTGQVTPVRELAALAREHDIELLVDGAHAFAHFPFTRDELGCDYYGTSLHKWLLAPIGTGFLYVRREKLERIWPLMAAPASMNADVRKFEEIGTHPAANHNAIAPALAFHRALGAERKAARLRYLRDRWLRRLTDEDAGRVRLLAAPEQCVGLACVHVEGLDVPKLQGWLWQRDRIITTPIVHAEFSGLRVTPNVYTTLDEVDLFADRMVAAMRKGLA
jgi:selenocysteine lyase/cysteine desulfurase